MSLYDARKKHYDTTKGNLLSILNKYTKHKFFTTIIRELNDPAFAEGEQNDDVCHDDYSDVEESDNVALNRNLFLMNNMRKWGDDNHILPENHVNFLADFSELLACIKEYNRRNPKPKGGGKKRSKKSRRRRTTSRRRSRAAR